MATRYWVGGSGTWNASNTTNWSATSGGAGGQSVPVAADTVFFDANSGTPYVTIGGGYNPTVSSVSLAAGTLDLGTSNLTMTSFTASNSGVRTLAFNNGALYVTGNNGTVFTIGTDTNLTISGSRNVYFTYSGATGTRTVVTAALANRFTNYLNIYVTAGTDNFTINSAAASTGMVVGNLNYTGFSGTGTIKGYATGNVTYSATALSPTLGNGSNGITMAPLSGTTTTFDLKGVSWTGPFTVQDQDGSGTVTPKQNITGAAATDSLQVFQGALDLATYNTNVNVAALSIGGALTRSIRWGSTSTLTLFGGPGTIFFASTLTNYSYTGTQPNCVLTSASTTGTRTISGPSFASTTTSNAFNIAFTGNATDTLAFTGTFNNIDFTNFNGTVNSGARGAFGNITYATTATYTAGATATTMYPPASTVKTLTTNGVTTTFPLVINGQGNVNLVGNYVCNANSTNSTVQVSSGNLVLNGANLDISTISISGTAVRGIVTNGSNINLWGVNGTIVTGTTMTNFQNYGSLTFNALGNSTSAQSRSFTAGTGVYEGQAYSINIVNGAGVVGAPGTYTDIVFQDTFSGNISGSDRTLFGNLTFSNNQVATTADPIKTGTTTFGSMSNTQTFTTRNVAFNQSVSCSNPYGNVNIIGNLTGANYHSLSLAMGNLNLNGYTATFGSFGASNYSTRQLQFGSTGGLVLTGNSAIILNLAIGDYFSYTGTANVTATYAGTTGARAFAIGNSSPVTATAALPLTITNANDNVTVIGQFDDLNVANVTGTWNATNKTLYGDYTVVASGSPTVTGSGTVTFSGNSTQSITTGTLDSACAYVVDLSGGTALFTANTTVGSINHVIGNLALNNSTVNSNSYVSNSGLNRTLAFGNTGSLTLRGSDTTVFDITNGSSFQYTGSGNVVATYSGTLGSRAFVSGTSVQLSSGNILSVSITDARDDTYITGQFNNLTVANTSGTWSNAPKTISGNLSITPATGLTPTVSGQSYTIFVGTNLTQSVVTANLDLDTTYYVNASNANVVLGSPLVATELYLNSGNLVSNNQAVTTERFWSQSGYTQRNLSLGNSVVTLTGTDIVWNTATDGTLTVNAANSTIVMTNTTADRTFAGGSYTFGNIAVNGGTTISTNTVFTGNNTFAGTVSGTTGVKHTVRFTGGSTTTVGGWTLHGTANAVMGITSTDTTVHNLVMTGGNSASTNYLNIAMSNAAPVVGNVWYAGSYSQNLGRDTGWTFANIAPTASGEFFLLFD